VGQFESAYRQVQGTQGQWVSDVAARDTAEAVDLYSSGLLEGWYHDWCIFERERLENVYLSMLSKLIAYHESRRDYETAILYGHRILRQERAHERTHWTMMRLYYLAGDRTSALRQYERCASALKEELGVTPAKWTMALREQIMNDSLSMDSVPEGMRPQQGNTQHPEAGDEAFFQRLQGMLNEFRYEIRRYIGPSGSVSGE
jgi:DNA-binding SARP family transcriptional activator